MRIPKSFKLFGSTIKVVDNPRLSIDRNWNAAACFMEQRIEMMPIIETHPQSKTKREQAFCHELMHFILYYGSGAINDKFKPSYAHLDEEFVECMGNLLHQALTTMEYK
jgi:predicted SprT family Zn-dependent metalloprotease